MNNSFTHRLCLWIDCVYFTRSQEFLGKQVEILFLVLVLYAHVMEKILFPLHVFHALALDLSYLGSGKHQDVVFF